MMMSSSSLVIRIRDGTVTHDQDGTLTRDQDGTSTHDQDGTVTPSHRNMVPTAFAGRAWAALQNFAGPMIIDVLGELGGDKVHRLQNGMTLDAGMHGLFDEMVFWFEEFQRPNAPPNSNSYITTGILGSGETVTFNTTRTTFNSTRTSTLPLPDPRYLRLHAAICRVAHLSGAAAYLARLEA
ncbi:hypothetical protein CC1G_15227 [Coprinopsis cinerea okayama7|uniref:HNH nuclease domain-containing protein n=1 Tax=Coprinopsis cinerea (strain Okayama-7 / 130 / ATCC MYA-4618 / FGSC 9003) TaxID=240176 RepID=D6RPU4_COPC7|nr:hypothetical protein CC1G_15227 [Coprinopsis cinerea okayama7\|eukprot:XP_002910591.1 hypothetical protein CC1G_15227 [Coprinopsis cinerea okayama7\